MRSLPGVSECGSEGGLRGLCSSSSSCLIDAPLLATATIASLMFLPEVLSLPARLGGLRGTGAAGPLRASGSPPPASSSGSPYRSSMMSAESRGVQVDGGGA